MTNHQNYGHRVTVITSQKNHRSQTILKHTDSEEQMAVLVGGIDGALRPNFDLAQDSVKLLPSGPRVKCLDVYPPYAQESKRPPWTRRRGRHVLGEEAGMD